MAPQLVATFYHLITLRRSTLVAIRGILSLICTVFRARGVPEAWAAAALQMSQGAANPA